MKDPVFQLTLKVVNGEEPEIDCAALAVGVPGVRHLAPDGSGNAKFFVEFPEQGLFSALTGFDLTPGELPLEGHGLVGTALAYQDLTPAQDQGR
ncbi:hypothetical protein C7378_1599 [Acidipila rosea]|uniref:Uncharacterized protein n=1 Tax=Acidipila rosea TaxID=768535 RepID=A0A4R1LBU7_9BACT|nr:hypothetical protein C7378_1599 [Acidipila rosea]